MMNFDEIPRPLPVEELPASIEWRAEIRRNYKTCLYMWRLEAGISRKEAAQIFKVSAEYIRRLETPEDEMRASLLMLEKMALVYNKSMYELFLPRNEDGSLEVRVVPVKKE